jgi:hypothetical protein
MTVVMSRKAPKHGMFVFSRLTSFNQFLDTYIEFLRANRLQDHSIDHYHPLLSYCREWERLSSLGLSL